MLPLRCFFVSDIHGSIGRYTTLFKHIQQEKPDAVFIGGDLFSFRLFKEQDPDEFMELNLFQKIAHVRQQTEKHIRFFVILGNDDPRKYEHLFQEADSNGLFEYVHEKTVLFNDLSVTGYSYVPPTPFQLKDWERYDVSTYVDLGSVSPEKGFRTMDVDLDIIKNSTISQDLDELSKDIRMDRSIFLFHSPPYDTNLDRAALDGKMIDHAPLDVHIGSIAIKRFIEHKQPFLTLHGHVHESTRLTGQWKQHIGKTISFNAAYDEADLVLIDFDTDHLNDAKRLILPVDD